eukprot:c16346_g1_i1.p1 GENE.c16346_g1_i1~~c16346_g1_i1.p1  ORF type:complete len:335 (-),score=83.52 c16346_g1_i1:70-1074(-)
MGVSDRNKEVLCGTNLTQILLDCVVDAIDKQSHKQIVINLLKSILNMSFKASVSKIVAQNKKFMTLLNDWATSGESTEILSLVEKILWNVVGKPEQRAQTLPATPRQGSSGEGHIMISYCWAQQSHALELCKRLKQEGFRTWMDLDEMTGSTLEAMANAVEGSGLVLLCVSEAYKKSQACRVEGEYAFRLKKTMIPVLVQPGYVGNGWLGALMGTKLYFDYDSEAFFPSLLKEIRNSIKPSQSVAQSALAPLSATVSEKPKILTWSKDDVKAWAEQGSPSVAAAFHAADFDGKCLVGLRLLSPEARLAFFMDRMSLSCVDALHALAHFDTLKGS